MEAKTEKAISTVAPADNHAIQVAAPSPLEVMRQAKEAGLSVDDMKQMLELQKEYESNEARKAFHLALAEFKRNPPQVVKDKLNKQYGSSYVSIGNLVNTVNEALGDYGLNARWDFPEPKDPNTILCTCILSHKLGHEEKVTLSGAPDTSGTKNPLQARKSTRTYLKLETFEAVTGVASVEGNIDDDGNGASAKTEPAPVITEEQGLKIHSMLTENELDIDIFKNWLQKNIGVSEIADIPEPRFKQVLSKVNAAIKAKKAK